MVLFRLHMPKGCKKSCLYNCEGFLKEFNMQNKKWNRVALIFCAFLLLTGFQNCSGSLPSARKNTYQASSNREVSDSPSDQRPPDIGNSPSDDSAGAPVPSAPPAQPVDNIPKGADYFDAHHASIPYPVSLDLNGRSQNSYRSLSGASEIVTIDIGNSYKYYQMTLSYPCTPWIGLTPGTCGPPAAENTSSGPGKIRVLIPPGVEAQGWIQGVALRFPDGSAPGILVGVHEHPNAVYANEAPIFPLNKFLNGFTEQVGSYNFNLQLVNNEDKISRKAHFVYLTIQSRDNIDFPITQFNISFYIKDRTILTNWLNHCGKEDLNHCVTP